MARCPAGALVALAALTGGQPVHAFAAEPVHKPHHRDGRQSRVLTRDRSAARMGDLEILVTGDIAEMRQAPAAGASRAAPFHGLPEDRYNDWRQIAVNFNASDPAL